MTNPQAKLWPTLRKERQRITLSRARLVAAASISLLSLCLLPPASVFAQGETKEGQTCSLSSDHYERAGYSVKSIEIETAIDFVGIVRKPLEAKLAAAQSSLTAQHKGLDVSGKFSNLGYTELLADLTSRIGTLEPGERFKLVATVPSLESCDEDQKTLRVVYWVVTSGPISYLAGIFEKRHDRLTREFAPGAFSKLAGKLLPQPFGGYNRSRAIYGGADAAYRFTNDLVNKLDFGASGSSSSATGDFALAGSKDFKSGPIEHAEWRLGYRYSNIPSDTVRLKDATVLGQFFAASRPLGAHDLILRFGSSVESGNRQSDLNQSSIDNQVLANSGYAAAKMYLGGTLNLGRQSWTGTYSLQLGANSRALRLDYVKQIFDTSYSVRFLPKEHLPFRVDAQFNAGHISSSDNGIPVAERFFGGNATREFIQGDDWQIRSTPFIRSFPQNRLSRIGPGVPIGGEKFFSANLTLAQTVWAKPAIPSEILQDVRVKLALGGQLASSRLFAVASYLSETKQFLAFKQKLKSEAEPVLQDIQEALQLVNPDPVAIDLEQFGNTVAEARNKIAEREIDEDTDEVTQVLFNFSDLRNLAIGFPEQNEPSKLGNIVQRIEDDILPTLQEPAVSELHNRLKRNSDKLKVIQQTVAQSREEIINNLAPIDLLELTEARSALNEIGGNLDQLATLLDEVESRLTSLPPATKEEIQDGIDRIRSYLNGAKISVKTARGSDPYEVKNSLQLLAVGYGSVAPAMLAEVEKYAKELQSPLTASGMAAQADSLLTVARELPPLQKQIKQGLKRVSVSEIERKANQDVAYTSRILDTTFRELNLLAISPVAMFDVARIGGRGVSGFGGTRYGLGGGLRLSVVSLDLTAGYSWNPKRRTGEGRGAFVFSLDISDLFR